MRAVRCEVCGAKAMIAAAQCPKCSHLFELRDGFGELLPLAYCSGCESYYPEKLGECKWCGTKPERPPIAPQLWRGVGAAVLVVLVGTAWVFRHRPEEDGTLIAKHVRATHRDSASLPADTALASTVAASDSVSPAPTPASSPTSTPSSAPMVVPQATPTVAPPPAANPLAASPVAAQPRRSTRWVSSVSRDWVIVRAGASPGSRIVASIGPNSRVQLGETQGSWRRIKARGVAGWVELRASFDVGRRQ